MVASSITLGTIIILNTGLVEILKKINPSEKYVPVISLLTGILLVFVYRYMPNVNLTIAESVLNGLVVGLMSIGAYSGVKNVIQDIK